MKRLLPSLWVAAATVATLIYAAGPAHAGIAVGIGVPVIAPPVAVVRPAPPVYLAPGPAVIVPAVRPIVTGPPVVVYGPAWQGYWLPVGHYHRWHRW